MGTLARNVLINIRGCFLGMVKVIVGKILDTVKIDKLFWYSGLKSSKKQIDSKIHLLVFPSYRN